MLVPQHRHLQRGKVPYDWRPKYGPSLPIELAAYPIEIPWANLRQRELREDPAAPFDGERDSDSVRHVQWPL